MRTPFAHALDQAMAIEHGMNGAFGRNPDIACQPPEQELADLACAPMRLFPFEGDNQALDLLGQLVGITHWSPRAIAESLTTMLPVAVENLVAGFTRYPELPAHIRHRLPIQQPGDKAKAFFHHRTLFPRHPHLRLRKKPGSVTHVSGTMWHPCLRPHTGKTVIWRTDPAEGRSRVANSRVDCLTSSAICSGPRNGAAMLRIPRTACTLGGADREMPPDETRFPLAWLPDGLTLPAPD